MSTKEYLCRHFSRMGARLKFQGMGAEPRDRWRVAQKLRIDVARDRSGEYFDIRCQDGIVPEVLDVQPGMRHLVLMARDGGDKNKFLLGHDERHWFAAAVPGDSVHDVRTAIASLRPIEIEGKVATRQGEWFFVKSPEVQEHPRWILKNEPLSRGAGSKPHVCEEMMRQGGETVLISSMYRTGISEEKYRLLLETNPKAREVNWQRVVRDASVYARGNVRHRDHKTIYLDGWHRVYMNRERFAKHAPLIAFLD